MIPPPDSCQTTALYAPGETMVTLLTGDLPLSVTARPLASAGVLHANPSKATRVILFMTLSCQAQLKGILGWECLPAPFRCSGESFQLSVVVSDAKHVPVATRSPRQGPAYRPPLARTLTFPGDRARVRPSSCR